MWKKKYLYPFGDIAPIQKHDQLRRPLVNLSKIKTPETMLEELQQQEEISKKKVEPSNFEELMSNKYRINIEDLGGSKKKYLFQHWIDELSKPL